MEVTNCKVLGIDILTHAKFTDILEALAKDKSFQDIKILLKELSKYAADPITLTTAISGVTHSFVTYNRKDLMCYVLANYFSNIEFKMAELLLYATACGHYEITNVLLDAGTDPFTAVNIENFLNNAPHELNICRVFKNLLPDGSWDLEGRDYYHNVPTVKAWNVVLLKDDVVMFEQIHRHFGDVLYGRVRLPTHIAPKNLLKVYTLHEACLYKAHTILDHCLTNRIYQFSDDNQEVLQTELTSLFETCFKDVKTLQLLYERGIFQAEMEKRFEIHQEGDKGSFLPGNQLHHVVSSGRFSFLGRCFVRLDTVILQSENLYLDKDVLAAIEFCLDKGVNASGLMMYMTDSTDFQCYFARPLTLLGIYINSWLLVSASDTHPCTLSEYLDLIHEAIRILPSFHPEGRREAEINPLFFVLNQTLDMMDQAQARLFSSSRYSNKRFLDSLPEALKLAENLLLYFLGQGFRFEKDEGNIYTVICNLLLKLEFLHDVMIFDQGQDFEEANKVWDCITEELGSFFLRVTTHCLAYHDVQKPNSYFFDMLCNKCMRALYPKYEILQVVLSHSQDSDYHQLLREITEFTKISEYSEVEDLVSLCDSKSQHPRKLQELCIVAIFYSLKTPVFKTVDELPLPKELKHSICNTI